MTAEQQSSIPSSRRALLAGAVGALAASLAGAFGRPTPARAGTDGDVVLGATNITSGNTVVETGSFYIGLKGASTYGTGVRGEATGDSGATFGVWGESASPGGVGIYGYAPAVSGATVGVVGESNGGTGIKGLTTAATGYFVGVRGVSTSDGGAGVSGEASSSTGYADGVDGTTSSPNGAGVWGHAPAGGAGVMGIADPAYPAVSPKTGVYGVAITDSLGRGVFGKAAAGRGVYGQATSGQGVRGQATTGAAIYGATTDVKKGYGLRALGRVKLDHCAGIATIASGSPAVVVSPGVDLVATSAVTATLMGNPGGATTVQRVAVDAANDTFTIYLTANATANVKVAWHVFG